MACRAVSVPTGGAGGLFGAEAVGPIARVTAATVGTVGAPIAVGCGPWGATKIARLAEAGGCRAAGATDVTRWGGAGGWAESPERKEAWRRFSAARAAAVKCSCASIAATRASHYFNSVWAVVLWRFKMVSWERRGAATRSYSVVPRSIAWRSESVAVAASADTRVRASPFSTSWRETCPTSARC